MNTLFDSFDRSLNLLVPKKEMSMTTAAKPIALYRLRAVALGLALIGPAVAWAFVSGSSGADGVLNPTVNTEVSLPASGVLNYTSINIPTGVTVTFRKNATNTPVVLLVAGDATIAGTINVSGKVSAAVGAGGSGNVGDDGTPGEGGPGGFGGGRGGQIGATQTLTIGGAGLGPGGGGAGYAFNNSTYGRITLSGGAGGGYAGLGGVPGQYSGHTPPVAGASYGASTLLPLTGGSGGGGAGGGEAFPGSGGGGGGGAILIAVSGTFNLTGAVVANGGTSGPSSGAGAGSTGGGGSGGAIRIVATTISGNGTISAAGAGEGGVSSSSYLVVAGGGGSHGRVRLEAETYTRTAASTPTHTFGAPGPIFIAGTPTLAITSVAGTAVPAAPSGVADVSLPATTTNPVNVVFTTTGVPVGNTVTVKVTPAFGATSSALSTALTGSTASATANADITLPTGPSTLQATVTYTIVASLGDILSRYAMNERVEKITLAAAPGQPSKAMLITVSGKHFEAPAEALRIAALGQ